MTNRREITPPPGFLTPHHIPNVNTNERAPVTTTVFAATTPGNTPFAYRASTSTDLTLMISLAFIEANYEILESLLRDRRRQIRNEDLRTELEYFREDYNKERGMEPRPEQTREVTPPLCTRSPRVHRQRERVIGLFADPTGSVTSFVCWIEDYPLPNELKMPSHVSSYDGKGDPDNFLHLFKGASRMQKWLMHVACHMVTYTHKDSARIWWNSQKAVYSIKQREGESIRAFTTRGQKSRDRFSPYQEPNYGLHSSLSKSPREILATEKVARSFEQPPRMLGSRRSRDMSKYCYFHEDHGHDINDSQQLRSQIEEAVKSDQLSQLVKGIKKKRAKISDSQWGEKKEKSTTPAEAPILMINQEEACTRNSISKSPTFEGREITLPPVTKGSNSLALVVIKAKIFERGVGRVHMDSGSSCESWAIGEVLLEITISDAPFSRSENLNFIIVRSNSPYNMLLGRTTMQKIGMVVSIIHGAVKFHTTQGIRIVFSTHESKKIGEGVKKIKETSLANTEEVLSYTDVEEKIIVNSKYPEQTVTIKKHLLEHFKERVPLGILPKVLPGRLQRLPSYPNGRRRRGQDSILRMRKSLLLPNDALRFKKHRSNVSKTSRQGFQ
ncbi:hypothetical protein Tco_0088605 [Tanacetum coccineum]